MRVFITSLLFFALTTIAHAAPETSIRILAVAASGLNSQENQRAIQYMNRIPQVWNSSNIIATPNGTPQNVAISVEILNAGLPLPTTLSLNSNDQANQQLSDARTDLSLLALRLLNTADVVIVFTPHEFPQGTQTLCGAATSDWVEGSFVGDPSNYDLDLDDRNFSFVTLVSATSLCFTDAAQTDLTAAHEFGHILGGAHQSSYGLTTNDRADVGHWGLLYAWRTVIGEDDIDHCYEAGTYGCSEVTNYSYFTGRNNRHTINTTAQSVANYYEYPLPPEPPSCDLVRPSNVNAGIIQVCDGYGGTQWLMTWDDDCEEASEYYEVWYYKLYPPYAVNEELIVITPNNFTPVHVYNTIGPVWVNACDSSGNCTNPNSSSYVVLTDQCNQ